MMAALMSLWDWLRVPSAPLSTTLAWLALLVGALLAILPGGWLSTRLFATYIHETGHAVAALATGRIVTGIRVNADSSGLTSTWGRQGSLGQLITTFAGYPAPALAGWGALAAAQSGHARWALAAALGTSGLLLLAQRSWRGLLLTVATGAGALLLAADTGSAGALALAAVAGYLLVASPRTLVDLHIVRRSTTGRRGMVAHSDADMLAAQTSLPAAVWESLFLAVCLLCTWQALTLL